MFNYLVEGFNDEMEKIAKKEDPSWWQKQKGTIRAMRSSDKGLGKILANDELVGSRTKKGLGHGLLGAGLGAGAGALGGLALGAKGHRGKTALLGSLMGTAIGAAGGNIHGMYQADKEYLKKRGITQKYLGLSSDFSPAARKKYIDKYEKK